MRRLMIAIAVLMTMVIPGVAMAGGGGDYSPCSGFATGVTVTMLDSCFDGVAHSAPRGETITVRNDGGLPHTLTAIDGSFDTGQLQPGQTYELTIDETGVYQVFCSLHGTAQGDGMAGVLIVGEPDPAYTATSFDPEMISGLIAQQGEMITAEVGRQVELVTAIRSMQANLSRKFDEVVERTAVAAEVEPAPTVVTVPVESGGGVWVPIVAGLAAGLAAAAYLTSLRNRRQSNMADGVIQPSPV